MPQPILRHIARRAMQVAIAAAGILAVLLVFTPASARSNLGPFGCPSSIGELGSGRPGSGGVGCGPGHVRRVGGRVGGCPGPVGHLGSGHLGSGHLGSGHLGSGHLGSGHLGSGHLGSGSGSVGHLGRGSGSLASRHLVPGSGHVRAPGPGQCACPGPEQRPRSGAE